MSWLRVKGSIADMGDSERTLLKKADQLLEEYDRQDAELRQRYIVECKKMLKQFCETKVQEGEIARMPSFVNRVAQQLDDCDSQGSDTMGSRTTSASTIVAAERRFQNHCDEPETFDPTEDLSVLNIQELRQLKEELEQSSGMQVKKGMIFKRLRKKDWLDIVVLAGLLAIMIIIPVFAIRTWLAEEAASV